MSEAIQNAMASHAWAAVVLVVVLAWLEYVVPPVPGDTTMLFGFFLAGAGLLSLPVVAAGAFCGSVLGAMTAYRLGARVGASYFLLRSAWARREIAKIERGFARWGPSLLVINRFIPGMRGLFLYAAGMGGMHPRPVLIHSSLSNLFWVALLAWAGTRLGSSWDEVRVVFGRYVWGIAIVLGAYVVWTVARARRARREAAGAGQAPTLSS